MRIAASETTAFADRLGWLHVPSNDRLPESLPVTPLTPFKRAWTSARSALSAVAGGRPPPGGVAQPEERNHKGRGITPAANDPRARGEDPASNSPLALRGAA